MNKPILREAYFKTIYAVIDCYFSNIKGHNLISLYIEFQATMDLNH